LLALESFVLVFEVEPVHGLPIARVDVVLKTCSHNDLCHELSASTPGQALGHSS
jgi:hypothetical protein